ncbi:sugar phosphate isomerase/epimerase family protein [Candidatus Latescibacterota bacterium]
MSNNISRRRMLAAGALSAGLFFGISRTAPSKNKSGKGPGREPFWEPGPNKNHIRDLKPGPTPIRLGRRFFPRNNESLNVSIKKLRDSGITGFRLGTPELYRILESDYDEFMEQIKQYDIRVLEIGGRKYPDSVGTLIHPDRASRQSFLKETAEIFEAAEKVGCPMVATIAGSRDPDYAFNIHPGNWTLETWKTLVESIKQLLRDTSGMNVSLAMEAQVTTTIDSPIAHRRLIDDVGDPRCAVELDPVNMISLATYYHSTELINECFDRLGESILSCHAKDTYIWPDKQTVHVQEVCAGRGVLDYETYLLRMSRFKWPRMLRPEHIPADQYPEADAYIRKVAGKVGVKIYG